MIIPLPRKFVNLSDEEFFLFCQEMKDFRIERKSDGTILIMEPTGSETGNLNADVIVEVGIWNKEEKGGKIFESNAAFTLPDNSVKSPDAAWIALERWKALPKEERERFAHISPDFVLEIRSKTDSLPSLKKKMEDYIKNGVKLAWLIDPTEKDVWIYRLNGSVEFINSFDVPLSGEDVLKGFKLKLSELIDED